MATTYGDGSKININDDSNTEEQVDIQVEQTKEEVAKQDAEWDEPDIEEKDDSPPVPPTLPIDEDEWEEKTLKNSDVSEARENVRDIQVVGDGDTFKLICKASSQAEGWMKSTKAMQTPQGCVVQVTTQQRNTDGTYSLAEALTFVPGCKVTKFGDTHRLVSR